MRPSLWYFINHLKDLEAVNEIMLCRGMIVKAYHINEKGEHFLDTGGNPVILGLSKSLIICGFNAYLKLIGCC